MGIKSFIKYYGFVILFLTLSCKEVVKNKKVSLTQNNDITQNVSKAIETIKEFYFSCYGYKEGDRKNKNLLWKKYTTDRFYRKIEELNNGDDLILDYDPFIYGQDYFSNVIRNTLKVKANSDKPNEFEVSFNRFELENEIPTKVVLYLVEEQSTYLIDAINSDDLLNLKEIQNFSKTIGNSEKKIEKVTNSPSPDREDFKLNDYLGSYSYFYYLGKLDEIASMTITYSFNIKKGSVFFSGQGYKTNFNDLCDARINKGTLEIHYKKTIEGDRYNRNKTQPLVKIYKKGSDFYAISSFIEEGKEIKLKKNSY